LVTAVGIFLSGLLQYWDQKERLQQDLGSRLLSIAGTGALLLNGDLHQRVVKEGRKDTAAHEKIRSQLLRIEKTNQLRDRVYTLVDVKGDKAKFAVFSRGEEAIGKPYSLAEETQPILQEVLKKGKPAYTDIYTNVHGTWITAFAPIQNTAGQTVAALEVDYRVDVYLEQLRAIQLSLYIYSLAGAVLALVAGVLLARQITRPVGQLSTMAHRVVEGDLTTPERITSQDEIGLLGNVLHLLVERVHVSHRNVVDVLVRVLQAQGKETGSLSQLASAALALGDHLDLSPTQREALELGALLHDIGEIRIPEAVLQRASPLTPEEWELVKRHPAWGVEILETVPVLTPALDVVGGHHERYDGGGYPQGLRAEEIPLTARVFAPVDALDAMIHDRPYRNARPMSEALEELRRESGKQFDPRVVDAALKIPSERWAELLVRKVSTD
jgi:HD-GYP domain-containing protein (c-di-GMP phosphodiesterase class II)